MKLITTIEDVIIWQDGDVATNQDIINYIEDIESELSLSKHESTKKDDKILKAKEDLDDYIERTENSDKLLMPITEHEEIVAKLNAEIAALKSIKPKIITQFIPC
jgi:hypothetical protein